MLKKLSKGLFPFLIAATALSVSGSAAYYSVTGLSKLFAGAAFAVMVMAGSLEVAKLVIASLLHRYWKTMNKYLRTYLTIATIILIVITSAGIYGFLSAAYQETANKATVVEKQVQLIETRKQSFEKIKTQYEAEKTALTENISSLRNALGNNTQSYVDTAGRVISYSSSANRKAFERQLETAITKDEKLTEKIQSLNDTILTLETQAVQVGINSDVAAELGPLKYLSGLTGKPMDQIINILLLVIIFVFDPLAVSLVIAANFAFAQLRPKKEEEIEETFNDDADLDKEWSSTLEDGLEEEPYQIYVSGSDQPGATLEEQARHTDWEIVDEEKELLERFDADKDGKIDDKEKEAIEERIKVLEETKSKLLKNPNISSWKKNKDLQTMDVEILSLKNLLTKLESDDDLVIKYT